MSAREDVEALRAIAADRDRGNPHISLREREALTRLLELLDPLVTLTPAMLQRLVRHADGEVVLAERAIELLPEDRIHEQVLKELRQEHSEHAVVHQIASAFYGRLGTP